MSRSNTLIFFRTQERRFPLEEDNDDVHLRWPWNRGYDSAVRVADFCRRWNFAELTWMGYQARELDWEWNGYGAVSAGIQEDTAQAAFGVDEGRMVSILFEESAPIDHRRIRSEK
ncbi:hypothetical protein EDD85DRAFT_797336 [Armillaria nabsnona]|nr:hypothetical protein EDD85DRAFT_797336 [Armillaria nabsnona]